MAQVKIGGGWGEALAEEFEKPYFEELTAFVRSEYAQGTCYPPGGSIFHAFNRCPVDRVKVVIIGQDPYHGPGQANGLCFSVAAGIPHPPSLSNIFKELESDLGAEYPKSGDLSHWAEQGVLLLNATLTVRQGQAGSHQGKGWEQFTDAVIDRLDRNPDPLVFLLWGGFARKKAARIDKARHFVLESGHPSPLSANRGLWFGNRHFSSTNVRLRELGRNPIAW